MAQDPRQIMSQLLKDNQIQHDKHSLQEEQVKATRAGVVRGDQGLGSGLKQSEMGNKQVQFGTVEKKKQPEMSEKSNQKNPFTFAKPNEESQNNDNSRRKTE